MNILIEQTREKFTNIANAIRSVNGEIREYTVDEMPNAIEELGSSKDEVKDGFIAYFYDENGELIQTLEASNGMDIRPPEYECTCWFDETGVLVTFPYELTKATNFYAQQNPTYADNIYSVTGINKIEYPYLSVSIGTGQQFDIVFGKQKNGNSLSDCIRYSTATGTKPSNFKDLVIITQCICEILKEENKSTVGSLSINYGFIQNQYYQYYYYTNFDISYSGDHYHRLDTPIDIIVEDPYALQEKTVTSNGDVLPDEDYYGLSKVTVNVEVNPNLQDKTITTNGEYTADDGYDGLGKVVVDVATNTTEIILQEKTATSNGELLPDEGYDGLSKVIVDVESGVNIDGGYVANFYDENGVLIQAVAAKDNLLINAPEYKCKGWSKDVDGVIENFPVRITEDLNYYCVMSTTYAKQIYAAMGLNDIDFPYLIVSMRDDSTHKVFVGKRFDVDGYGNRWLYEFYSAHSSVPIIKPSDYSNLDEVTQILIDMLEGYELPLTPSDNQAFTASNLSSGYYYTNFDLEGAANLYRLDMIEEEEPSPFYTVNFYDYDKELIETHTAKVGNQIGAPLSFDAVKWEDSDGIAYMFPTTFNTVGDVINLYISTATMYEDLIYDAAGLNKEDYPYLLISTSGIGQAMYVEFYKSAGSDGYSVLYDAVKYTTTNSMVDTTIYDLTIAACDVINKDNPSTAASNTPSYSNNFYIATNYDIPYSGDKIFRLDTIMY